MKNNFVLSVFGCLAVMVLLSPYAIAQRYEVDLYGGAFNPDRFALGELKTSSIFGVRGGVLLTEKFQLEGNFGYINHFEFKTTDPKSRGLLWEGSGSYNFGSRTVSGSQVVPFLSLGFGGVTVHLPDGESAPYLSQQRIFIEDPVLGVTRPLTTVRSINMQNNNTFFMVSYGGGLKALRLWGPVGLRGELKGRTMPNFFGDATNWIEGTGGITFSWGER